MAFDDSFPNLDLSYTMNIASEVQRQFEESNRKNREMANEAYETYQRMKNALEETASNTAETNLQLQKVVSNQNDYIEILKEQLLVQKQQLEFDEQQLAVLKNIFSSNEDNVSVEKEIMRLIQNQIDSQHPLWDYVKDKGGDLAVAGITASAPVLYEAFKAFLASKGIRF